MCVRHNKVYCTVIWWSVSDVGNCKRCTEHKLIRDKSQNPCTYVHCHEPRLNLVLVDLAKNVDRVAESHGLLEAIYAFQAVSTIRHKVFIDVQTESDIDNADRVLAMPQQSDTQWVCKYVAVHYFKKRFACVVQALHELSQSVNKKEAAEACGLLMKFKLFEIIFFLHVLDVMFLITAISMKVKHLSLTSLHYVLLYILCKYCDNSIESVLCDRIVLGICDASTQKLLLREGDLSLNKTIDICKATESAVTQVKFTDPK